MDKPRKLRISLAGLIVLVAVIAIGIAAMRPKTTRIIDVKVGTGPAVKVGDTVSVHYSGHLKDGTTFDSSKPRGEPFTFKVGGGMVIKGWDIGLIGMQQGGVREIIVPPDEAYGARGVPPMIPPNSPLRFEIELLNIK